MSTAATDEFRRPTWEADENAKTCSNCDKEFSFFRRHHHCRGCGGAFCDDCSLKRIELPPVFKYEGKQRVCDECYHEQMATLVENDSALQLSKPDYPTLHATLAQSLRSLFGGQPPWVKRLESRKVTISTMKLKHSPLWYVKTQTSLQLPLARVWSMYTNRPLWKQWSPDLLEIRCIEQVSDDVDNWGEVLYIAYRVPVIDNRDTVVYSARVKGRVIGEGHDECYTSMTQSMTHPACPHAKGFVRAHLNMGCTIIEKLQGSDPETTQITTILHADPKGLVPLFAVNQAFAKAADQIADMVNFMLTHPDA